MTQEHRPCRPLRIALVAPPWVPVPPPAYGGTEAVLDNLARGLRDAGHDVMLFATGDSECDVPTRWVLERAAGMVGTGSATELHHVVHAYEVVQEWGADVVHDQTLVGPVYAQRFDIPVVTTNHGSFDGELGALYRAVADRVPVVAVSNHHAASATGIPIAAAIHHGVDVDAFPLGGGRGGYAVFLGRMSPDKGVHVAARIARDAGVPLRIAASERAGRGARNRTDVDPMSLAPIGPSARQAPALVSSTVRRRVETIDYLTRTRCQRSSGPRSRRVELRARGTRFRYRLAS
jgi:hypothetical protein